MDWGELLTRWTVRFALSLYVVALALRARAHGNRRSLAWARLAWTTGCLCFLLHVVCAFHFYHAWSHAVAYASTARQTAEVVGFNWGGGLYANYAFTLVWAADACCWWHDLDRYETRPRGVEWSVQGFLGFMAFNGTVVFGRGAVRWLGLGASLYLAAMWWYGRRRPKK